MNAMLLSFDATGTCRTGDVVLPHWPHLDPTGGLVPIPESECDLTSLHLRSRPTAETNVRLIQEKLGMTIGQVAKALGCSRQAVHGWMRGNRIDPVNIANLQELTAWATEWSVRHPARSVDPDRMDAVFLEKLGRLGVSTPKARALWEASVLRPLPSVLGWDDLPGADEIARRIGAQPVSELERGHRRAHNLGTLRIDAGH
ncbi:MAG: hypothetical protein RL318_2574 [Fibrobacterota bacterium]|jgi:transcriptional regulator with XRE-family HTH domain